MGRSIDLRFTIFDLRLLFVAIASFIIANCARADDLSALLSAPKLPPYKWFASTDPKNQNADYVLLKPGETRRVPLAKGVLLRLWSTGFEPEKIELSLQNDSRVLLLKDGKARLGNFYEKAFTFYPDESTPASARQLKDGAAIVVTNHSKNENKWFYQAAVRPSTNTPQPSWKSVESQLPGELFHQDLKDAASQLWRNWYVDIQIVTIASQQANTFWSAKSAGCISEIRFTPQDSNIQKMSNLKLQLTIEGQRIASLTLDQLSARDGEHSFQLLIPFSGGAELALINEGKDQVQLKTKVTSHPIVSDVRLSAVSGSARSQKGKPIPILSVTGEGAFVGLVLDIRPAPDTMRRTFAFLEGNETLIADGKRYEGTGTEDYFNSAWYYPEKPFSQRYNGMTFKSNEPPRVTTYRWMIPDAVPFKQNFRFELEHGNGSNSNDLEYRWVAFWYQKPPFEFEVPNELDASLSTPAQDESVENNSSFVPILVALAGVLIVGIYAALRRARR